MPRRKYPTKSDDERRVVISFTLSDDRLMWFREMLCIQLGAEPTVEQIREYARDIAQSAISGQIKLKLELDDSAIII